MSDSGYRSHLISSGCGSLYIISDILFKSLFVRQRVQMSLNQTAAAGVSVSGIECRRPYIRHLMQESVLQTTDAGVSISDKGPYAFIWYSGACFSNANHASKSLYYKQRLQELLCQTPGYGASLTEDCNRQRVHESLYQTHVQILKVLSEGVKTPLKMYHHLSSEV